MLSQQQQLQAVQAFAQEKLGQDTTGHGMDHLKRVARLAKKIAQAEGVMLSYQSWPLIFMTRLTKNFLRMFRRLRRPWKNS